MTPLRWTRTPPTEAHAGCYFWREDVEDPGEPEVVLVGIRPLGPNKTYLLSVVGPRTTSLVKYDKTSLWAGPIAPPEEDPA